jgi:thiol-disulfide isomerase/thioredoxin
MKEISIKELREKIANKETMLVSFSTDWCGPCKMLKEELKKSQQLPLYIG